jgi:PAS domain S-box-containing protein
LITLLSGAFPALGEELEPLRIGIKPTAPPFSFLDTKTGDGGVRGLSVDMGVMMGKLLHREVRFIATEDLQQGRDWLRSGRIDVIFFDSPVLENAPDFAYIPLQISLRRRLFVNTACKGVVCLKDLSEKRVVMVSGDAMWSHEPVIPPRDLVVVNSPEEALQMLNNGVVDVFVAPSERVAEAYIAQNEFQHVHKVGVVLEEIPLFLTIKKERASLEQDLRRAMNTFRERGTMELLKDKWFGVSYAPTLWSRYGRFLLSSAAVTLGLILFVLIWNQQLKAKVRSVTRELEASEKNFRNLIESSPEMIFVVDETGLIRHANTLGRNILPPGGQGAHNLFQVVSQEDLEDCRIFLNNVLENGFASAEMIFRDPRGSKLEVDVDATLVEESFAGEPCACLFARDVTERNHIEDELAQADRLVTIGKLAAGVAHEINNPLGIVLANVELILSGRIPLDESKEFLEAIRRNAVRAGNITRQLLAMARPQNPRMSEVNLYALVEETLTMLRPQIKGIEVVHTPPKLNPEIWADYDMLQQVVVNVILNAKAALEGVDNPRLGLRYCCPDQNEIVRLFFEDNGKGIPRGQLNDIFEPFVTSGKPEGFGLGLFISRRIVERHGGVMYAESTEGKGTLVVIELPKRPEEAPSRQS